jgi:hypothetical protein
MIVQAREIFENEKSSREEIEVACFFIETVLYELGAFD